MVDTRDSNSDRLLDALIAGLNKEGFGRVCSRSSARDEALRAIAHWDGWIGRAIVFGIALCFATFTGTRLGQGVWAALATVVLTAVLVPLLSDVGRRLESIDPRLGTVYALAVLAAILGTLAYQIVDLGPRSALLTHALPVAAAAAVWLLGMNVRRVRDLRPLRISSLIDLVAATPLLVAIALLIAVVPLFSEDLWSVAAAMEVAGVVELGCVTVLPMTVIVLWYLLVTKLDQVVTQVSQSLRLDDGQSEKLEETIEELLAVAQTEGYDRAHRRARRQRLRDRLLRRKRESPGPARPELDEERILRGSFGSPAFNFYVRYVQSRLKWILRAQIGGRVMLLIVGTALGFTAYIYAIAWIVVPAETASTWAKRATAATWETGLGFAVPYGPHLSVAVVMAVIATAILLALVVTTSEMDTKFVALSTDSPIKRCVSLTVPVAKLWSDVDSPPQKMEGPSGTHAASSFIRTDGRVSPHRTLQRFEWTTTEQLNATIDTMGTSCDTFLAVYAKSSSGVRLIKWHDHPQGRSRISYDTTAGCDYVIVLDAFSPNGDLTPASVRLNWMTNNRFEAAQVIERQSGTARGNNVFASRQEDEPDHAGRPGGASVWYRWTAPLSGEVMIDTAGSTFDTLLAVYTGTELAALAEVAANDEGRALGLQCRVRFHATADTDYLIAVDGLRGARGEIRLNWGPPANDDFDDAEWITGRMDTARGNSTAATKQVKEPDHAGAHGGASVWYAWIAPGTGEVTIDTVGSTFDTLLAVYTGTSVAHLRAVAANDDAPGMYPQSRVTFSATAATEYRIAVDGYGGQTGEVVLNWQLVLAPPNDAFDAAQELQGASGTARGHNLAATRQEHEPEHAGKLGGASVWYRWIAPASTRVTIDTAGSTFTTLLAVYTGTSVQSLEEIAAHHDAAHVRGYSRVDFDSIAGTEYRIAVDGYHDARGEIMLNWGPPDNDDFDRAQTIEDESGTTSGNNTAATGERGEPKHAGNPGGASVWYRWVAPASGEATFDTAGSQLDTLLAVYTGQRVNDLTAIAANDDAPDLVLQSRVRFAVRAGEEYRIAVDGYHGRSGAIVLNWRLAADPPAATLGAAEEPADPAGAAGRRRGGRPDQREA